MYIYIHPYIYVYTYTYICIDLYMTECLKHINTECMTGLFFHINVGLGRWIHSAAQVELLKSQLATTFTVLNE